MPARPYKAVFIIGLTIVLCVLGLWLTLGPRAQPRRSGGSPEKLSEKEILNLAAQLGELEAQERQVAETAWKPELLAQRCGTVFERLWDAVNAATNKLAVLAAFEVRQISRPAFPPPRLLAHDIRLYEPTASGAVNGAADWRRLLDAAQRDGWELAQMELRHNQFTPDAAGRPKESRFYCAAHLTNASRSERAVIEGDLIVHWTADPSEEPMVDRIDASRLAVKTRRGNPAFQLALDEPIAPFEKTHFIDPLMLYDLDGDGLSEIVLAGRNLVLRRGDGQLRSEPLCAHPPGLVFTGLIADFDGDGVADFLCARFEGLLLFKGSARGTFDDPGQPVWPANPRLKYAQVLTCGDIDHDGDLDVWLGQYKVPYERGQMPTPYYEANDGHPSFLLLNDGRGNFTDATEAAGLAAKRWRRAYSGSFADLDNDGDLDLLVVSDFAGLDVFRNDGTGRFTDATRAWIDEPHAFGMAHARADFDRDGRLDLLMIGMNSPAADRLAHLQLTRPGFEKHDAMRAAMVFGNRLYLSSGTFSGAGILPAQPAQAGSTVPLQAFHTASFNGSIARSGWSWGCSAFDFDNDGFTDVHIANGHETRPSVRDYEREFWLHDIYLGNSRESIVSMAYFGKQIAQTRGQGDSFGGHERNRFYWNQGGQSFLEIAHLMGVAMPEDSRNVVADDLDGDGRMDLIVTTFEAWPVQRQTLRIFQNTLPAGGNWIGFRLREPGGGRSPVGARVTVQTGPTTLVREILTGDSYRSQHANTVHFGLGTSDQVRWVEVRWANGDTQVLEAPEVNRYHMMAGPGEVK